MKMTKKMPSKKEMAAHDKQQHKGAESKKKMPKEMPSLMQRAMGKKKMMMPGM